MPQPVLPGLGPASWLKASQDFIRTRPIPGERHLDPSPEPPSPHPRVPAGDGKGRRGSAEDLAQPSGRIS